jgi:hypothetical protein
MSKQVKIVLSYDDWCAIAEATENAARREQQPDWFNLAARLNEHIGHNTVAASLRSEAGRVDAGMNDRAMLSSSPTPASGEAVAWLVTWYDGSSSIVRDGPIDPAEDNPAVSCEALYKTGSAPWRVRG